MRCIIALGLVAAFGIPATVAAQPTKKAPLRIATANDMKQLQLFIATLYLQDGEMPTVAAIRATLKKDAPTLDRLIENGSIMLTGAKDRSEVWAYDKAALESGGWVATMEGVQKMTAEELRKALGK